MTKRQMLKQFITLMCVKKDGMANKDAEIDFFKRFDKEVKTTFQQFNTICYIIGNYVDNNQYTVYESDVINECLEVIA